MASNHRETRSFLVSGTQFVVDAKYQYLKTLGQGAYGVVCAAKDSSCGQKVAIKKIPKAFEDLTDAKRTLREIRLLRHMNHENVIKLKDIIRPACKEEFDDVYMVTELMDTDLHQIIRSSQPLSDDHCQYFIYQILRSLKYIHSGNVLHRDLKPSNILVNRNCDLKLCDFGLARFSDPADCLGAMTEYVVTRWYRAPELILSKEYTKAIDIWSAGCILAELLGRRPLFQGQDYVHQLEVITNILGSPHDEDMKHITNEKARAHVKNLPRRQKVPYEKLYPNANKLALDLIEKMLQFDPYKRITAEEALRHPYLEAHHDPDDEPEHLTPFDFEYEHKDVTREVLLDEVWKEMIFFHPEAAEEASPAQRRAMNLKAPAAASSRTSS
eukprot:TRINITY_DN5854_c0_g1::TRINITY_DN5854_c0_g1_i1::g.24392::m.24392 TRINITY_DN5854_c0_g1::TRINITY_DN5854_c0_g1_i1::g.24392  ORF type:complete len:391 (+),score=80.20,sp/P42525/ERK1_DICDI/56.85/4e-156,Pkinase/PF00069.20/1.7e-79,Pkinase_Tyr/PF07714.12/5.2e-36,Kdo/PF06293.9/5.9e-05,APH/PF01636.18/2.2e+03,APH/PF01636.18/0.0098,Kinase-like/PF14531.1/4.4e+02,Kinase-like/PF14531.1/0.15,Seadorna_VP7/PF07387.6/0.048 TRINITY_DN5854_c0_g1_i1:24-1175(+)